MSDLIARLRALAAHEHDDHSVGEEAAEAIEAIREQKWREGYTEAWAIWLNAVKHVKDTSFCGRESLPAVPAADVLHAAYAWGTECLRRTMEEAHRLAAVAYKWAPGPFCAAPEEADHE